MSQASTDTLFLRQAEGYLELELPRPALDALGKVSAGAREQFQWSFLTAECHRQLEDYESALPLLQHCVALRPEVIGIYINLGWCFKRTGQLPKAIDALRSAHRRCLITKEKDELPLVMYNLGCYYSLAGQKDEMLFWLKQALDQAPKFRKLVDEEADFDNFRNDPDFLSLVRQDLASDDQAPA